VFLALVVIDRRDYVWTTLLPSGAPSLWAVDLDRFTAISRLFPPYHPWD
jgi:hypothetical protein